MSRYVECGICGLKTDDLKAHFAAVEGTATHPLAVGLNVRVKRDPLHSWLIVTDLGALRATWIHRWVIRNPHAHEQAVRNDEIELIPFAKS